MGPLQTVSSQFSSKHIILVAEKTYCESWKFIFEPNYIVLTTCWTLKIKFLHYIFNNSLLWGGGCHVMPVTPRGNIFLILFWFLLDMVYISLIFVFVAIALQYGSSLKDLEQTTQKSSMQTLIDHSNYLSNFHSGMGKC